MLSYEIDGSILTLRASGSPTPAERQSVFDAVRSDARVPKGALVLLDVRKVDVGMSEPVVTERLRVLLDHLGPKLGPVCALIVTPEIVDQAGLFQAAAVGVGLRVALFSDEQLARHWLNTYRAGRSL
jgi:hypothetical protein